MKMQLIGKEIGVKILKKKPKVWPKNALQARNIYIISKKVPFKKNCLAARLPHILQA